MTESTRDTVNDVGSGMCELTNQRRLGFREGEALKKGLEQKLSISDGTESENWCAFWALKHVNAF